MAVKQGATAGILRPPTQPRRQSGQNAAALKKAMAAAAEVNRKKKGSTAVARKKAIALSQKPKIPGMGNIRQ